MRPSHTELVTPNRTISAIRELIIEIWKFEISNPQHERIKRSITIINTVLAGLGARNFKELNNLKVARIRDTQAAEALTFLPAPIQTITAIVELQIYRGKLMNHYSAHQNDPDIKKIKSSIETIDQRIETTLSNLQVSTVRSLKDLEIPYEKDRAIAESLKLPPERTITVIESLTKYCTEFSAALSRKGKLIKNYMEIRNIDPIKTAIDKFCSAVGSLEMLKGQLLFPDEDKNQVISLFSDIQKNIEQLFTDGLESAFNPESKFFEIMRNLTIQTGVDFCLNLKDWDKEWESICCPRDHGKKSQTDHALKLLKQYYRFGIKTQYRTGKHRHYKMEVRGAVEKFLNLNDKENLILLLKFLAFYLRGQETALREDTNNELYLILSVITKKTKVDYFEIANNEKTSNNPSDYLEQKINAAALNALCDNEEKKPPQPRIQTSQHFLTRNFEPTNLVSALTVEMLLSFLKTQHNIELSNDNGKFTVENLLAFYDDALGGDDVRVPIHAPIIFNNKYLTFTVEELLAFDDDAFEGDNTNKDDDTNKSETSNDDDTNKSETNNDADTSKSDTSNDVTDPNPAKPKKIEQGAPFSMIKPILRTNASSPKRETVGLFDHPLSPQHTKSVSIEEYKPTHTI